MKPLYTLTVFLCLCIFGSSCKKSPNDGVPIYMRMDSVSLRDTQGLLINPQGITDVWVEAGSANLGAYELPINFPVLDEGRVSFNISAGVWESGQSTTRDIYPFYDVDTFSIANAIPGTKYSHHPAFTYKGGCVFEVNENFEFNDNYDSLKQVPVDTIDTFLGQKCGKMTVTETDTDIIAAETHHTFTLPAGSDIWLDLEYKTEVPFWVGLLGNYNGGSPTATPVILLLPKGGWNKTYIKLSNIVGSIRADNYQLYFEAIKPNGGNPGSVYIDNIKVVHQ